MYKLGPNGVIRLSDGMHIPSDPKNIDWQEYVRWVAQGNTVQPELTLSEAKTIGHRRITEARNRALSTLVVPFDGDQWDGDEATSTRIANALAMISAVDDIGQPAPSEIPWRTYDNKDRVLSVPELTGLGAAIFLAQQAVWARQAQLKNAIDAAQTVEEANGVVW